MTNSIFCYGDGFAAGHIWPEWPQIIQALLPEYSIVNCAGVGAGAEWLVTQFVHNIELMHNSRVFFQWPDSDRFDKLLEDDLWDVIIKDDPVYHFNVQTDNNQKWWLSSASKQQEILQYHARYIQPKQHKQRIDNYQILIQNTLENLNCQWHYFSTQHQDFYSKQARFNGIRLAEVQPSPLVHFYYVVEELMPALNLQSSLTNKLENLIKLQKWIPYDPDRKEIWDTIVNKLNQKN